MPLGFARLRFAPGAVAAGNHQRRAEVGVDVIQIQVRGADLHRQFEGGIGQQAFRQLHGQVVGMQLAADKARAAAPGGLADDMAVRPECRLGQFDHPGQIEKTQPERRAIEHALVVVVDQALVVPVDGFEPVDGFAQFRDRWRIDHRGQQHEAMLVHGGELLLEVAGFRHGGAGG